MAKNVILPPGIGSYVTVLEPKPDQQGKLKYSLTLLISKARTTELEPLRKLLLQVAEEKWPGKGKFMLENQKYPVIKNGDTILDEETGKPKPGYAGMFVISMRGDRKPQVIDAQKQEVFTDDDETGIYSGCMLRVSGSVFAYEAKGNKGVSVGLNNVQVLKRGARLDGRKAAVDEFAEWSEAEVADPLA
jgi:hypothetical protein